MALSKVLSYVIELLYSTHDIGFCLNELDKANMSPDQKEFTRCLEDILEECGLLLSENGTGHREEDHWVRLSLSLSSLSTSATRYAVSQVHSQTQMYVDQGRILLELESALRQVHKHLESFTTECLKRCSFQLATIQKAESFIPGELSPKARVVLKSLGGGIRSQLSLAKAIAQEILGYLPRLYSIVETGKTRQLAQTFSSWCRLLRQRCISYEASPWQEAVELLDRLQYEASPDNVIIGARQKSSQCVSIDSTSSGKALSSKGQQEDQEDEQSVSNSTFVEKVLKRVAMFVNRDYNNLKSFTLKSILIVGPGGSGKSFICENISNFAETQGFNGKTGVPFLGPAANIS